MIVGGIIGIGLYKLFKGFFSLLNRFITLPYTFLETSLNFLCFFDLKLSNSLVKFIGFVTPRTEFFTVLLYLIFSVPLLALKTLFYTIFLLLMVPSLLLRSLKIACFAIFVPPCVYAYDLCSLILYYGKFAYHVILGLYYKIAKLSIRVYLLFLDLRLFKKCVKERGNGLDAREMRLVMDNVVKRFRFEQFGGLSSTKVVNYYDNSGTFDLNQYFLGSVPFSTYIAGRYAHEHNKFTSKHELMHNARFFYQSLKKRKLLRFSYPVVRKVRSSVAESPMYNTIRVFEYHRYMGMGLVNNFDFSSFPEHYRLQLFNRLLRFNLIPAINFYYNIFNSTLRNKSKNPDFWIYYGKMVTNPAGGLTWFEYSRSFLLKDPIFSYNNRDYTSPVFGRKLTNRRVAKKRFRELSLSEGSRLSFDDYRSSTESNGRLFVGSHFTQFVDDYDHYLKAKVHYKSKMERFWFKRVLLPDSGLASDRQVGLPELFPNRASYKRQIGSFFRVVFIGFFGGVFQLYNVIMTTLLICCRFLFSFLLQLKRLAVDLLFKAYLFFIFLILRLPGSFVRGKRKLAPVYEFFTYPIKMTPFSVLWASTVLLISFLRTVASVSERIYGLIRALALGVYSFATAPFDFMRFIFACAKEGSLESLVAYELDVLFKEVDDFIEWLLNDPDK
jgi:hypothetical protein